MCRRTMPAKSTISATLSQAWTFRSLMIVILAMCHFGWLLSGSIGAPEEFAEKIGSKVRLW